MPVPTRTKTAAKKSISACRLNRRLSVHYPGGAATADGVAGLEGVIFQHVRVYDISQGGIALVLNKPLTEGDIFYIQVANNILGFSYDVEAVVKHNSFFGEGHWVVGLQFPRELTLAELAGLV